jgi:hypothetical protein
MLKRHAPPVPKVRGPFPWETGVFIRIYQPDLHRATPFLHTDALYLPSGDFVVSVVRQDRKNQAGNVSEMVWLYPEEVRLLATLALAIPEGHGSLRFAPLARVGVEWPQDLPLSSAEAVGRFEGRARELAAEHNLGPYELHEWRCSDHDWQVQVFEAIDPSDGLLIRGLHCLLKANRLAGHPELAAEGYMNVSISREAALELIRQRLHAEGNPAPSFRDAHVYLSANFQAGRPLADFLLYQHDLWVETKHPNSQFGPVWMPQLMADDLYETYEALVSVYRHILSGELGRSTADL